MNSIKLGKMTLKNPVVLASGTFERAIASKIDIDKIGAITTKTITMEPRIGNPMPHIVKTRYGFLNSVGLKNLGIEKYLSEELPFWKQYDAQIITSIGGDTEDEYCRLTEILEKNKISAIEVNVSCPNVDHGVAIGSSEKLLSGLVSRLRKIYSGNLIVKLSPNVTNITEIAKAAISAGADALTIPNTFLGMAIDNKNIKPILKRVTGGYSGPAVKPLALRAVWEVYTKLKCPIIGGGGIENFDDALDFVMCGASAIYIGSANYTNPSCAIEIADSFEKYLSENKISSIEDIRGMIS